MNAIIRPIRENPLIFFVIFACFFGWILFIASALGADISPDGMPLGPIVAAAIVALCIGRAELKEWGRRLVTFRTSPGWYVLAISAPIAIIVVAVLVNSAFGAPLPTRTQLAGWPELLGAFVFILVFIGIGEEAGWTAFAAHRLLDRYSFLAAWVIMSAIRVFWHLPLMLVGDLPWVLGIGGNIAFQFLLLWIFKRSGKVWFLAAIWHAVLNTTGGSFFFQMVQGDDQARLAVLMTAGYILVAIGVFLIDRHRLTRIVEPVASAIGVA